MATMEPIRWITAVSSALSGLDFTIAFQLACSSAPNSTAATTGQVRIMWLSGPWQRVGLEVGEALHRLLHPFLVPQPRILDAAEGRELQPVARHLAHVHCADLQLIDEAGDVVQPVGAHRAGQAVGRAV